MKCEPCTRKECSKKTKTDDQENAAVNVRREREKGEFHKLADARIFLSDCLGCDSCVTTEEGVQVSQQNTEDFFRVLNLNKKCDTSQHKVLAESVCPQSLPYFVAKFSLSVTDASRGLCGLLKSLGAHYSCGLQHPGDTASTPATHADLRLPRLGPICRACAGSPRHPHLCTAKSPQQIMGCLVKDYFTRWRNLSPDKIFHVIVALCYDKKLEAL
ncbi:hypothetical protein QTO34_017653 [Cnephaeus nilssonii]|uniref:Iron hydrogenase large subunit C-terminal domain-containing protein n=1 Tax=Cnephaeus nilssonii TaxID=3371016 RepID=A0AA40LQ20_CNENI|nr:hypothetical protein QTO34_017653 [Eptesicus nilssonii]